MINLDGNICMSIKNIFDKQNIIEQLVLTSIYFFATKIITPTRTQANTCISLRFQLRHQNELNEKYIGNGSLGLMLKILISYYNNLQLTQNKKRCILNPNFVM